MNTVKATLFVALFLMPSGSISRLHGQWKKYIIDDSLATAVSIDTADLDGDSRPDLVVNSHFDNDIFWYQNNYPSWIKHTVDEFASNVSFAWFGDFDGDGTADIVANLLYPSRIVWYENNLPTWTRRSIDSNPDNTDFTLVSDINGDGRPDVITCGNILVGGDLVWYEYQDSLWIKHIIEPGSVKWGGLFVADMDGDGMPDVVADMVYANRVVWFKNEGAGLTWTKDTIDNDLFHAWGLTSGDINGDGTLDVVATAGGSYTIGSGVFWYENQDLTWNKHDIDPDLNGANTSVIRDMNGDGKPDVVVTGFKQRSIVWYEQTDSGWIKHIIDDNILEPRMFLILDVDGDLFDDIILSSKTSLVWYRHPGNTAYALSFEVSPITLQPPDDTVTIRANLYNPENHPMNVFAVAEGAQSQFVDTIPLFDDGAHEDGDPADHVWANKKVISGFPEDVYEVELVAYDLTTGNANDYLPPDRFITLGPVSLENYSITSSQQVFSPGELIDVTLTLRNNGTTAVAPDIYAKLESIDPNVMVSVSLGSFGDIAAGEISTSDRFFQIRISDTCPVNTYLPVAVDIYHEFQKCWRDTFLIYVNEEKPVTIPEIVAIDTLYQPELIEAASSEDGMIYLVPMDTDKDMEMIRGACLDSVIAVMKTPVSIPLEGMENGTYWLYATDTSGNISEPTAFTVMGVGIEQSNPGNLRIFPNPTYTLLTIETDISDLINIEISSLNGKIIVSKEMEGNILQLDLSSHPNGVYFITIRSKDYVTTRKIVKL